MTGEMRESVTLSPVSLASLCGACVAVRPVPRRCPRPRLDPRIRIHGWTVIAPPRVFLSLGVHTPGLLRPHDA